MKFVPTLRTLTSLAIAAVAICSIDRIVPPSLAAATDSFPIHLHFQGVMPAFFFHHAVEGAGARLRERECSDMLNDFRDEEGNTLAQDLDDLHQTPIEFLSDIRWIDVSDGDVCRTNGQLAAYTTPGQRSVFVCASRFVDTADSLRGPAGEIVILHEFLHVLGLGENPPSSSEITAQVRKRC